MIPALKELSEQLSFMGDDAVPENEVMRFLIDRLEHMTVSEAERTDAVSVSVIGSGIVSEVSLLTGMLKVQLDKDEDMAPVAYHKEDVKWGRDFSPKNRRSREENKNAD